MPSALRLKAPAKINLFLNLLHPREDGFHEVCFVMQALDLADELLVTQTEEGSQLTLTCSVPELATPDNLISKAYSLFYQASGLPPTALQVHLEKRIPVQAGLGGGSSDAAAMLTALNSLHQNPLDLEELCQLGARLGSDVPFFFYGGTAVATGRGEVITPCPALPPHQVVLLKPRFINIPTPNAYQWVREHNQYRTIDFGAWQFFLNDPSNTSTNLEALLYNDFEPAVLTRYPELTEAKETLMGLECKATLLSGSGPTLFGLLPDSPDNVARLQDIFPAEQWFIAHACFSQPVPASA